MIEEEIRVAYRIDWREGILHFESRALASLSIIKSISLSVVTIDSRKWRNNCTRRGGSAVGRFGIVPAASLRPI